MITSILLAMVIQGDSHVYERVQPQAGEIAIEAVIRLKDPSPYAQAVAKTLALSLKDRTVTYSVRDMRMVTNGPPVRAQYMPDEIRIGVSVPPGNLKAGFSLLESLLKEASLSDERINQVKRQNPTQGDPWTQSLSGSLPDLSCVVADDVRSMYHQLCQPDNIWVGVAGAVMPAVSATEWQMRCENWPALRPADTYKAPPKVSFFSGTSLTTVEFSGEPIRSGDVDLPSRMLALIALGGGKGSDLFQVCRRQQTWSYRQEAFLWPTTLGWTPRIILAIASHDGPTSQRVRSELSASITKWSEEDRLRALGFATSVFRRGLDFSPLYFTNQGPPSSTIEDQAFLAAYWGMKTGRTWDAEQLIKSMNQVNLEDLREAGQALIKPS